MLFEPEKKKKKQEKMKKWNHIINSMTNEEINNPEIIEKQTTRLGRIAKGSGTTTSDIRQLIKQYKIQNNNIYIYVKLITNFFGHC